MVIGINISYIGGVAILEVLFIAHAQPDIALARAACCETGR